MTDEQPVQHQFLLVMMDNPATGEIEVGGTQQPIEFNRLSPSHVVGRFIQNNLEQIVAVAVQEAKMAERLGTNGQMENRSIVMPASQVGLISGGSSVIQIDGAGTASQGVQHVQA